MKKTILVTGGAGYIGSHTSVALLERDFNVVIADDLSNSSLGSIEAIKKISGKEIHFEKIDLTNIDELSKLFNNYPIESVIHFAGLKAVGESVEQPLKYYETNLVSTINLLNVMQANDVYDIVFSSSATVYGVPKSVPIKESADTSAINPYGQTKLMIENICRDLAASNANWRISLLRYFNPIGADQSGELGEDPAGIPNNLAPYVMQVAIGKLEKLSVFGDDWGTKDGTGVRDYIHVSDLALGHIAALENLSNGAEEYNLGTGTGYSVLEVIAAAEKAVGKKIPYEIVSRRPGDIAECFADPSKAIEKLGWRADKNLDSMMIDAWNWQSKNPEGFKS